MSSYIDVKKKVHRLVPSKFPPVLLFDWADTKEELEQIAALEGLTNERLKTEIGDINLVSKDEWVSGEGSTPIMAAFTYIGYPSRFADGSFGVYYAADSINAAIRETKFHRERFYAASKEAACSITMREYIAKIMKPLVQLDRKSCPEILSQNIDEYSHSQKFAIGIREQNEWGIYYPSVRSEGDNCVAIFRPKAISVPITQGGHYRYIWDGQSINAVYKESKLSNI